MEAQEKRTISSEGERYPLKENEVIGREYPPHQSKKAHSICLNKAIAYPEFGWRNVILNNGNVLIIVRKNDKTSRVWDKAKKMN
jgi:hypothetical protein